MMQENEITAKLDTGALVDAWAEKKGRKPKLFLDVRFGAHTDLGRVRENNEDKFEFFEPEESELLAVKGCFYAVADGMGGHSSGQIASELALKTIIKTYFADAGEDVGESLTSAVSAANSYIYETAQAIPDRNGMGTTCTALVLREDQFYVAQVGDSRIYLVRDGKLRQVSEDHSWVAEQVKRGAMTLEEAEMSPFRNVITRSLGVTADVETDIYQEDLKKGDLFVLCSDGLSGYVTDDEILELTGSWSPSVAAMKLIDRANEHGGGDNVTAVVVSVSDIRKAESRLRRLIGRG
ncbi:MAG TPA: Stp1/IreP family PP2C-type Ser/Thr phosphatase [Armatimonadota bacterium]